MPVHGCCRVRLSQCTAGGWRFPWSLRVALCEALLCAVFDSIDEAERIAGAQQYLALLQASEGVRAWSVCDR
jgi:hypothetical protein